MAPLQTVVKNSRTFIDQSEYRIKMLNSEIAQTNKMFITSEEDKPYTYIPPSIPLENELADLGEGLVDDILSLVFTDVQKYEHHLEELKKRSSMLMGKSKKQGQKILHFTNLFALRE